MPAPAGMRAYEAPVTFATLGYPATARRGAHRDPPSGAQTQKGAGIAASPHVTGLRLPHPEGFRGLVSAACSARAGKGMRASRRSPRPDDAPVRGQASFPAFGGPLQHDPRDMAEALRDTFARISFRCRIACALRSLPEIHRASLPLRCRLRAISAFVSARLSDRFPNTPPRLRAALSSLASKALHPPNRPSAVSRRHLRSFDPV